MVQHDIFAIKYHENSIIMRVTFEDLRIHMIRERFHRMFSPYNALKILNSYKCKSLWNTAAA